MCILQIMPNVNILVSLAKQASDSSVAEHVTFPHPPLCIDQLMLLRRGAWCCSKIIPTSLSTS